MHFPSLPPSTAWQMIPWKGSRELFFWVWFKPPSSPQGLLINLPSGIRSAPLTMWTLFSSIDISPSEVLHWTDLGQVRQPGNSEDPVWNEPLVPGDITTDRTIVVTMKPVSVDCAPPAQHLQVTTLEPTTIVLPLFSRIEGEWNASLLLESQMEEAARQMNGLLARVTSMNRDLNFDETRYSDQGDRNEWAEARRWLREGAGRLSRYLREQQLSVTFSDAKRKWCEQTYQKFIVPRVQFEGIERADREFEAHRRALQSLLNNMKSALTYASEDALRRAQRVQTKIAAKVRAAQTKRP